MSTLLATSTGAVLSAVFVSVHLLYQWLLPKPIPGIPYNPEAAKRLFGDAPDMLREVSVTGEFGVWCATQVKKMNSPVCQVFIRPFAKPWVLLADFRESRDILMRRREFDKSRFISDGMACLGEFHGLYRTGPEFKSNRQLLQDLMTSTFLNGHAGHAMHTHGLRLINLLELKRGLAQGRPFSVSHDIEYTAVDTMLTFAFADNWDQTTLGPQTEVIEKLKVSDLRGGGIDDPVDFPHAPVEGEFLHAIYEAPKIMEKATVSWSPKLSFWWWSRKAWYKQVFGHRDRVIREQVQTGLENLRDGHAVSAVEHMLMRETARAEKEGRKPQYDRSVFIDETFASIIAGHHTTSGAIMWAIKYLTRYPDVQSKLRHILYASLTEASREKRIPSFQELQKAHIPYLDAVIEEVNRLNAFTVTRHATVDTQILGYPIPKGTEVFMVSNGPGFLAPHLPVDDARRTEPSRAAKLRDYWDEAEDLTVFRPERWLSVDGQGNAEFDGAAGPQLVFGLGPRACWGRRLAVLEMRTVVAMLVWTFEMLEIPESLSSYRAEEGIARAPHVCYVRLKKACVADVVAGA
ncbi:cytochrome P450 [Nemania sp. FL0031]|nr:cytochrome P450 [Nemania sp. FL0031]